jgi:hypothetical protein
MIHGEPFPVKKICLWFIAVLFGIILSLIIFIGFVSIQVGFKNMNQDGFFIPILCGSFIIAACLIIFIFVIKYVIRLNREKDIIRFS